MLTNNAKELAPYIFEFEYDTNRKRKDVLSVQRFDGRYLG
jgi:hypothetical protein